MNYNYTVKKRKANRITYRVLGIVFIAVVSLQCFTIFKGYSRHLLLTSIFCIALGLYGIYLVKSSFRKQAFDITYSFNENGFDVKHHYGEKHYDFEEIEFITMVIPDESMIFYILNIRAGKDTYVIPFTMQKELCETIYEFVYARIKHDEEPSL